MTKDSSPQCTLIIMVEGFDEAETVLWLILLRRAGLCAKSVGLTSGLISSAHGVQLMPDLALTDIDRFINTATIELVILPAGERCLAKLQTDPRVHRLLRQVVAQESQIVTGPEGIQVLRAAGVWGNVPAEADEDQEQPVLLYDPTEPFESFAQHLIRRLKR